MGQRSSHFAAWAQAYAARSHPQPAECDSKSERELEHAGIIAKRPYKRLVDDVIINHIIPELDVPDIHNLRQVDAQFRNCTTDPVVWKRMLERTQHQYQLPPLPPTERYSFANLSSTEAERLFTRASTLKRHWDKDQLPCARRWDIDSHRIVLEIALLPGGQYLVAAMADRSRTRFSIEVFTSDFNYSLGFPVARLESGTKAFDLRAKYMTIHDEQGIVIGYVTRTYRRERYSDRLGSINTIPSDWNVNSSRLVKYECTVVHIPLSSLELLYGDHGAAPEAHRSEAYRTLALQQRRPFRVLTEITSRSRISNINIDEDTFGIPIVAVMKEARHGTDHIVHKNLDGGLATTMHCTPHPSFPALPHAIIAFTILPNQQQFLLVRRAGTNQEPSPGPYYFLELYDIVDAPGQTLSLTATARSAIHASEGNHWEKVWLSDHGLGPSLAHDPSIRSYLHSHSHHSQSPQPIVPQPIVIFVNAALSYDVAYEPIIPVRHGVVAADGETVQYRYTLSEDEPWMEIEALDPAVQSLNDVYEHRILPGSTRPLIVSIPRRTLGLHKFEIRLLGGIWDEQLLGAQNETRAGASASGAGAGAGEEGEREESGSEDTDTDTEMEDGVVNTKQVGVARRFEIEPEDLTDISTIAWDETIGRLCIGYAKDTRIAVFDFAGAPMPERMNSKV
ncbi:hypothetical protein C8Q74DRAFT_1242789 [Fomes fomentarius]|nr:hypothetical protein C8Q74DRAFT_1242789 [Fomes fomentarius]